MSNEEMLAGPGSRRTVCRRQARVDDFFAVRRILSSKCGISRLALNATLSSVSFSKRSAMSVGDRLILLKNLLVYSSSLHSSGAAPVFFIC